jgi:hypothetical protein
VRRRPDLGRESDPLVAPKFAVIAPALRNLTAELQNPSCGESAFDIQFYCSES